MRKEAWTYSLTAGVMGAFGVLMRWLQCQNIFEPETGLAARGHFLSVLMVLTLLGFAAALWRLSGRMSLENAREEPEDALAPPPEKLAGAVLAFGALIAGAGAMLLFFTEGGRLFRLIALLGLLSAAVLAMLPQLPRWGAFGAWLAVTPVLFFALWLVGFYKERSVDPVLWAYAMQILATAACLLAAYRLCGCVFYRLKLRQTLFSCGLATAFGLSALMDPHITAAARLLFAGWSVGCGALCWVLLRNLRDDTEEEEEE